MQTLNLEYKISYLLAFLSFCFFRMLMLLPHTLTLYSNMLPNTVLKLCIKIYIIFCLSYEIQTIRIKINTNVYITKLKHNTKNCMFILICFNQHERNIHF